MAADPNIAAQRRAVDQVKEGMVWILYVASRGGSRAVSGLSVPFYPLRSKTFRICVGLPVYSTRALALKRQAKKVLSGLTHSYRMFWHVDGPTVRVLRWNGFIDIKVDIFLGVFRAPDRV